ncbi:MAG: hypothetical protein U0Q22_19665 [Acidimicrobiales bacterium]
MTDGTWWDESAENAAVDLPTAPGWVSQPAPPQYGQPPYQQPPQYQQPQYQPPQYQQPQYQQPQYQPSQPAASKPKRQRTPRPWGKIAIASLATIAVLAGAWVAYGFVTAGGASSPEAAVTTLLDGATSQDPLLMASVLSPGELPLLTELLTEVGEARKRVGGGEAGEPIPGTTIKISNLRTKVKELSPRVSRVTIQAGRLTGSVAPRSLPDTARSALLGVDEKTLKWKVDVDDIEEHLANGISAIVVEDGGGWYVSPTLTAADLIVGWDEADLDKGDFGAFGDAADFDPGADTPDAAVEAFADAISSGEVKDLVAALPSDQSQVGVVFSDAIETILNREVESDAGAGRLPKDWAQLKSFDAHQEDGPDGMVRMVIDSAKVTVERHPDRSGDKREYRLNGLKLCKDRSSSGCTTDLSRSRAPVAEKIDKALGGSVSLMVREVDDGWKVDPVASLLDMAIRLVKGVDKGVADSAAMSLEGKATALTFGTERSISFDGDGLARVAFPTKPGTAYYVAVNGSRLDNAEVAYATKNGGARRQLSYRDNDENYVAFLADTNSTTIALGGLLNEATTAKVTAYEVPIEDHPFETEVQGTLAAPVALHRVPITGATAGEYDDRTLSVDANASGGDIGLGFSAWEDVSPGDGLWLYDDVSVSENSPEASEVTVYGDTALVAISGPVGAAYTYRIAGQKRGFDGNRTSGTVTIPADSTTTVDFDLGSSSTDFVIGVQWSDAVDVDGRAFVGGNLVASDTRSFIASSFRLPGSGSGSGQLVLQNYGQSSTTVNVSIDFG